MKIRQQRKKTSGNKEIITIIMYIQRVEEKIGGKENWDIELNEVNFQIKIKE